jgi:hypothetical protein
MALDLLNKIRFSRSHKENYFPGIQTYELGDSLYQQRSVGIVDQSSVLSHFQPLPPYSTVLGICNDGLPLLLDLSDPNPGAILITGLQHSGKMRLLRSILLSACNLNTSDQLYFYLVTPNPGLNHDIGNLDNCYGVYSSYDRTACELVVDLAALAEQRKSGRHLGTKCILAIDNLYELIKHQDFEVINHLKWLFRYGANNGIWVISTLESERSYLIEDGLLSQQKTHIVAGNDTRLLPEYSQQSQSSQELQGYRTRVGMEWVDFWLPSVS